MTWHTFLNWRAVRTLNGEAEKILTNRAFIAQTIRFGILLLGAGVTALRFIHLGDELPNWLRTLTTIFVLGMIVAILVLDQNDANAYNKLAEHLEGGKESPPDFDSLS